MSLYGFTTLTATPASPLTATAMTVGDTSEWPTAPFYLMVKRRGQRPRGSNSEAILINAFASGSVSSMTRAQTFSGTATTALSLQAGDECYPLPILDAGSDGIVVPSTLYPATIAGIQAAHDALPSGGLITVAPNNTITSLGTKLTLTNSGVRVNFNNNTLKAPAGSAPYVLIQAGASLSITATHSLTANSLHGSRLVTVASNAAFTQDGWVIMAQTGYAFEMLHRIKRKVGTTQVELYRPVERSYLTANTAVILRVSTPTQSVIVENVYLDNNGNTSPGLKSTWATQQHTTLSADAAVAATSLQVTSSAGFAAGDLVLVKDSAYTHGQAAGQIFQLINPGGVPDATHVVINGNFGGIAYPLTVANGATVDKILETDMLPSVGLYAGSTAGCQFRNITGANITGSMFYGLLNYENYYENVIPTRCGFNYNASSGAFAGAEEWYWENGSRYQNCYSVDSLSWGSLLDVSGGLRGDVGAEGAQARGVKLGATNDSQMTLWAHGNRLTGAAISDGASFNQLDVKANGNGNQGFWSSDQGNLDNYIRVMASNNGAGDVYVGPTDLRTIVEVLNEDADAAGARGVKKAFRDTVAFNAGNHTASAGTWTVGAGDHIYTYIHRDGKNVGLWFEWDTTDVSLTPVTLRYSLPSGMTIKGNAQGRISGLDNNGACQPVAIAGDGLTYIAFYVSYEAQFSGAMWAASAGFTYLQGYIAFEVA